jgi:hypothetical protein
MDAIAVETAGAETEPAGAATKTAAEKRKIGVATTPTSLDNFMNRAPRLGFTICEISEKIEEEEA